MPTRKTEKVSSPAGPSPAKRAPAAGGAAPPLKESMVNGRASPAKASVGDGWCFCCGGFAGHVKLMFVNGAALEPVPPVTPVAMGRSTLCRNIGTLFDSERPAT